MAEIVKFGGSNFQPSAANTGNEQISVLRGRNMMLRGSDGSFYFEAFGGIRNLSEPIPLKTITGTLAYTSGSDAITGTGTLFKDELRFGMKILAGTQVFVVGEIVSDTSFISQRAADATESAQIGYKVPILFNVNDQRGSLIWGNGVKTDKGNYVVVGEGRFRVDGAELTGESLLANRNIQIALYQPADGTYRVEALGYDESPEGVTVTVVSGGSKNMSRGYYSFRFAWANYDTGYGFSNPSEVVKFSPSASLIQITADNQRFEIDFTAALANKPGNADSLIIYRSQFTDATTATVNAAEGSWFVAAKVQISELGAGDILYLDVLDGELGAEVTFDNDAPPDADWVSFISGDPVLISCYGDKTNDNQDGTSPGPFISPGKRGNRDAFPADIAVSLSPPDTIIGFVPGVGRLFLMTRVSLPFASGTGQSDYPVVTTPFWETGFKSPFGLVLVNDTLYAFTSKGVTRSISTGDRGAEQFAFAASVEDITRDWVAGYVHAVHDRANEMVVFIYSAAERNSDNWWISLALPFYLRHGIFGPLIEITKPDRDMIVTGAANIGGKLQFLAGGRGGSYTPPTGGTMNFPLYFAAAAVFGSDVGTYYDLPTSGGATPVAKAGSNIVKGVLEFPNTGATSAQFHFRLPDDWTGIISAKIMWSTTATSGNMKWNLATSFTDTANANDPDDNSFNTADTVTQAAPTNASDEVEASIASLTTTGAVAGGICNIKVSRNSADAADTVAASVFLTGIEIVIRRNV
jgi:hypothetical protein